MIYRGRGHYWKNNEPRVAKQTSRLRVSRLRGLLMLLLPAFTLSCENDVVQPPSARFGHFGEVKITVTIPLHLGAGVFHQELTWRTSGGWALHEEISYRGTVGGTTELRSSGDPSRLASNYAELIVRLNEAPGLSLFIDEMPIGVNEDCGLTRSEITVTIHDEPRNESVSWQQCMDGALSSMSERGAGPLPAAPRLVAAGLQVRDATIGPEHRSAYHGSIPFGTLARGEDSAIPSVVPLVIKREVAWRVFWAAHQGTGPVPSVDFQRDLVLVALVGERQEAGEGVEVRSIFQTSQGTVTNLVERAPGDFCSPASRTHRPFHVVVAPRTPGPHDFNQLPKEYVPCGA